MTKATGRLDGRVAVVTGGGDGIGEGICRRLGAEGARVLVADLNLAAAERVAKDLADLGAEAIARHTDVRDKAEVRSMIAAAVEAWGTVDILVNNAWGGGTLSRLELKTDDLLAHGMAVAYYGPFWAMQACFPIMKAQGRGNIINLCSLNGVNAHIGSLEYNASKEALRTLTRTAAREWATYGIVANAVCPAAKSAAFKAVVAEHPEIGEMADAANPMGRMGDPEADIAPVVAFLASDDCRYLTGNTLYVDGGGHINGVVWAPELPEGEIPD